MVFVDYGAAQGRSPESSSWKSTPQDSVQQFATLAVDWREAGARRLVDSWFPEPDVPESLKARLAGLCIKTDPAVVSDMRVREAEVPDREEYLERISVPTLILQSGSGQHQGREQGKFIHERVKGSQLFYFEGRGHGFFMSAPEEFWRRVEDFLATLN